MESTAVTSLHKLSLAFVKVVSIATIIKIGQQAETAFLDNTQEVPYVLSSNNNSLNLLGKLYYTDNFPSFKFNKL